MVHPIHPYSQVENNSSNSLKNAFIEDLTMIVARNISLLLMTFTGGTMAETPLSPILRGSRDKNQPRNLLPHPSSGHHSSYQGCLAYSEYQLSQMWTFPGTAPSCSWYNDNTGSGGGDSSSSSGSSSGGSSGGSGGSGSGSSGGGGSSSSGGGSSSSGGNNSEGNNSDGSSSNGNASSGSGSNNGGGGANDGGSDNQQNYENVANNGGGGGNGGDPFSDFDIAVCESYENLWLWDLSLSCNDSLVGCNCTFAAELFYEGLLSCDDAQSCPQDCSICSTCMSLLGCDVSPDSPLASELISSKILLYLIAAGVAMVIIMMAAYYSRRHKDRQDLKASLMAEENLTKLGVKDEAPGTMYMDGAMPWKPSASHADLTEQTLQPVSTMSTTASRSFFEESRIQTFSGESLLGKDKSTSDSNDDEELSPSYDFVATTSAVHIVQTAGPGEVGIISPISTPGVSLNGDDGDDDLENSGEGPSMLDDSLNDEN